MPLYEYRCSKCGDVFEVLQKISDAPLTVHDGCGGEVEKLISAPSFQFKGSGWYITDYARSGDKGEKGEGKKTTDAKSDGGSSSGSQSGSDAKSGGTDSKPAEKKTESKAESKPAAAAKKD